MAAPEHLVMALAEALRLALESVSVEFQLAADIVATTVNPSGQLLIQLAAIALIRTFLNFALTREAQVERAQEAPRP